MRVIGAFVPDMVREALKDAMSEAGMTEDDLDEFRRKLESPAPDLPDIGSKRLAFAFDVARAAVERLKEK